MIKKGIVKVLLTFLLVVNVFSIYNVYAKESVFKITNIQVTDKSDGVIINGISLNDNIINNNIMMTNKDDYIKYSITIKNMDEKRYIIKSITDDNDSEYLKYVYDDLSNVEIAPLSEKTFEMTMSYVNESDSLDISNKQFNIILTYEDDEQNIIVENISNGEKNEKDNPNTSDSIHKYLITGIILIILIVFVILTMKKKKAMKSLMIIGLLSTLALPYMVKCESIKYFITFNNTISKNIINEQDVDNTEVSLNKSNLTLIVGNIETLVATVNSNDENIIWTSSDETIVEVDDNGKVTGLKEGIATITATIGNGKKAVCTVTVIENEISDNTTPSIPEENKRTATSINLETKSPATMINGQSFTTANYSVSYSTNNLANASYYFRTTLPATGNISGIKCTTETLLSPIPKAIVGNQSVTLTWEPVVGATKYAVSIYKPTTTGKLPSGYTNSGNYALYTTTLNTTSYTLAGLENGEKYTFLVQAYSSSVTKNGGWSWYNEANHVTVMPSAITFDIPKPSTRIGNEKVTLTWEPVAGATKYAVSIYKPGTTGALPSGYTNSGNYALYTSSLETTSYTFDGLENGKTYTFLVQSYVPGNKGKSGYLSNSDWSAINNTYHVVATPKEIFLPDGTVPTCTGSLTTNFEAGYLYKVTGNETLTFNGVNGEGVIESRIYDGANWVVDATNTVSIKANEISGNTANSTVNHKIFIVGDSISSSHPRAGQSVADEEARGVHGIGEKLNDYYNGIEIVNYAVWGGNSVSFLKNSDYTNLMNNISEGDYLLIEFGINESLNTNPYITTPYSPTKPTTYDYSKWDENNLYTTGTYSVEERAGIYADNVFSENGVSVYSFEWIIIEKYIKPALKKGATPILITPIHRIGIAECNGTNAKLCPRGQIKNVDNRLHYAQTLLEIGEKTGTPVIDLTSLAANYDWNLYNNNDSEGVVALHSLYISGDGGYGLSTDHRDYQHLSEEGSVTYAHMIAYESKRLGLNISNYLYDIFKEEENVFDSTKAFDCNFNTNTCQYTLTYE